MPVANLLRQPITMAEKICPDAVIVPGEDLNRFRDASKDLYSFLTRSIWSQKSERLGFDEVFLDVSDMVEYNVHMLNHHDLPNSFFHLNKHDPTAGFEYDASSVIGHTFPDLRVVEDLSAENRIGRRRAARFEDSNVTSGSLEIRLRLGSHLARYLRIQLAEQKGYTASVGIR